MAIGCIFTSLVMAQAPKSAIDQFLVNPTLTLQQYPNGGSELTSLIRDAVVAHPEALQTIVGLLTDANSDQQSAMGSGFGLAAKLVDQKYANEIATAIANAGSKEASTAFAAIIGDTLIGSVGGGDGGPGGGSGGTIGPSGGGTGGGSGPPQTTGEQHTTNVAATFTGAGVGGATPSGISASVSPH
jgi:hypothetical protein